MLKTPRLTLRPWSIQNAGWLYEYARHPEVGPRAGWPCHTSVQDSRNIIEAVLRKPEVYAIVPDGIDHPVGCISLMVGAASSLSLPENEGEIGYWIGVPFWGQGLAPEALRAVIGHAFCDLHLDALWCGYFDGNDQSRRVQEKCGFRYQRTEKEVWWPLLGETKTQHITCLTQSSL